MLLAIWRVAAGVLKPTNLSKLKEHMEQITPTVKREGLTMQTDAQELALSLKTYRLRNGLTLPELGKRWDCSRYTLMRIEAAKHVSWTTMYKVASQLIRAIQDEK